MNALTKEKILQKSCNKKIKEILPYLSQIKFKFTKRECVDRKILKLFKKFIKEKLKHFKTTKCTLNNSDFWEKFLSGAYTPPFKIYDESTLETIEFKTMNTLYIAWIFQNDSARYLYTNFIEEKSSSVFYSLKEFFEIKEEPDSRILKYYILNFHNIFSNFIETGIIS